MTTTHADLGVLLEPLTINGMTVPNRVVMAPMGSYQDRDGIVGEPTIAYYRRRAEGGTGAITVENVVVSPGLECWDFPLFEPEHVPGVRQIADAVHGTGTSRVGVQLVHPGRVAATALLGGYLAPSAVPLHEGAPIPRVLEVPEIRQIVQDFGASAALAKDAGFDYVEVHGAHGFLIGDFLGSKVNLRDDEYGGDAERRGRFAVEIVQAIRAAVGPDYPVWFRISMIDAGESGIELEESVEMCRRLEAAGVDCLSISAGTHTSLNITMAPMYRPRGHMVQLARAARDAVGIPVAAVGRLDEPELAASVLAAGDADLITIGRGLIAEPDWVRKIAEGRRADVRPCLACNACVDYITHHGGIRCAVNPEVGREAFWKVTPAEEPRSVMVVGAGPAGLQAAQTAAERGHRVSLWDRGDLGGKLGVASLAPGKGVVWDLRDQLVEQVGRLGVEVHGGVEVSPADVEAEDPDVLILAVGADPLVPSIPGVDQPFVVDAVSLLLGETEAQPGERIVVVGSAATGLETAEHLVDLGATVSLVEMSETLGAGIEAAVLADIVAAMQERCEAIHTSTTVIGIGDREVACRRADGSEFAIPADRVALAVGFRPRGAAWTAALAGREVHAIGDADHAADFVQAIGAGADLALTV